jgi:hypothetical protein
MKATIRNFLQMESAAGIVLMAAAALALIAANSPLSSYYDLFVDTPVEIRIGAFEIAKPLLLWVNDGLMAVFFFLVGLEVKREVLEGELSRPSNVMLPLIGAVGGIVAPVAVYTFFNYGDAVAMNGWAIPAATDIAFALGILMMLGSSVAQGVPGIARDIRRPRRHRHNRDFLFGGLVAACSACRLHVPGVARVLELAPREFRDSLCSRGRGDVGGCTQVGRPCDAGRRRTRDVHSDACQGRT